MMKKSTKLSTRMDDLSFKQLTRPYVFFCRWVTIMPLEGRDWNFIITRIHTVLNPLFVLICFLMQFVYIIEALVVDRPLKVEHLYFLIFSISGAYRFYKILWQRKQFNAFYNESMELWQFCNEQGRQTFIRYDRKIKIIFTMHMGSVFLFNILLPIQSYMTKLPPVESNATERRELPFSCFTEYEPYKLLGYDATLLIQFVVFLNGVICGNTCDTIISVFIMHAAGYFKQLADRLNQCFQLDDSQLDYIMIRKCFKYHQRLLRYCQEFQKFSSTMLLTQMISSCYGLSLVLIKLTGTDPDKYGHVPVMTLIMSQLLVIHWTPDRLADQSKDVSFAAYSVLMRRLDDKRLCRQLYIMLTRAQVPVQFKAGSFVDMNLEAYGRMLKGAYSFYMVLRYFYN